MVCAAKRLSHAIAARYREWSAGFNRVSMLTALAVLVATAPVLASDASWEASVTYRSDAEDNRTERAIELSERTTAEIVTGSIGRPKSVKPPVAAPASAKPKTAAKPGAGMAAPSKTSPQKSGVPPRSSVDAERLRRGTFAGDRQ